MNFGGIIKQSLVDYPGEIATVLFTRGCNFRCPYCHNGHLLSKPGKVSETYIKLEELICFLEEQKGFLDAVVISGGEPTLNSELPAVCRMIKDMGLLVKLDTNGTNPVMLEELIKEGILDYIAMDVKASLEYNKYLKAAGRLGSEDFLNVMNSIYLLKNSPIKIEFRTTVVPELHSPEDILEIAKRLKGARRYSLQQFNPRYTLDPGYENILPYSKEELEMMAEKCRSYIEEVKVLNI